MEWYGGLYEPDMREPYYRLKRMHNQCRPGPISWGEGSSFYRWLGEQEHLKLSCEDAHSRTSDSDNEDARFRVLLYRI